MSTYERRTAINDPRIEEGHEVVYCELRGYDSPDSWHEVFLWGCKIAVTGGSPRERKKAIALCKRAHHPMTRYERLVDDNPDRELFDDDQVPEDPEAGEG